MAQWRKKPVVIEATLWHKMGDHPKVVDHPEGEVKAPDGGEACGFCKQPLKTHGWIITLEGGFIVCPGDYVLTGVEGETYACKPGIFLKTYEPVETVGAKHVGVQG